MPIFKYVALKDKNLVNGKIEANDAREARETIRSMGLIPTNITADGSKAEKKALEITKSGKVLKLSLQEKIEFTSTLQILVQSGIPIIESLLFIENDAAKPKVQAVARELRKQIMSGSTFSDTIAKYREQFGAVYVGLCKAGEDSGELEVTLSRLEELLQKEADIKAKVIGALMYPAFVVLLALVVVLVMLMFVFPVFKDMFDQMGKELPWITATLMAAGIFLKKYWFMAPLIIGGVVGGTMGLFKWEPSKRKIDELVLKIPLLRDMVMFANYANHMAVLQVSYDAGVPIIECLYLSNLTLTNYILKKKIEQAALQVQQGQHLSMALRATGVVPKMILFMVATGEQSGRLGEMLLQAVYFIDKKLAQIIDTMTKLIEPFMLVFIGSIVLVLALSLYLPLFQSYIMD